MNKYTESEVEYSVAIITATITKCEKMQLKFSEGSSQHSLLKNRIKALYISKVLLNGDDLSLYTKKEIEDALPPIVSIISKTTKAQAKYEKGNPYYTRHEPMLHAMKMARACLEDRIERDIYK